MTSSMTAIVENGIIKPDGPLPFPDQTRVKITIESVGEENQSRAAWNRLLAQMDEHPIAGLAAGFSRDALYERD